MVGKTAWMSADVVINILELVGLYVFATSGALMAIEKGFDLVGIVVLAMLTALGGGILRDLIIGDTPPAAFSNVNYLVIPMVAAVVTFFAHPLAQRLSFTVLVFDAAGLGLFCVTGTLKGPRLPPRLAPGGVAWNHDRRRRRGAAGHHRAGDTCAGPG
jgi:uncharacterized membrane protein YeiH